MAHRGLRWILSGVVGAGVLFAVWDSAIKPQVIPKRLGVVTPGLIYRSGKLTPATMSAVVHEHHIRTIVDLGAWVDDPRGERLEAQTAKVLGVRRNVFDLVGDSTGDPNDYLDALRLMTDPESQPVLVHCGAGTERTGALVYLYRTIVEGKTKDEALSEARRAGHDPRRNPRLAQTLERWEGQIARAYREGGQIEVAAPHGAAASSQAVPMMGGNSDATASPHDAGPGADAPQAGDPSSASPQGATPETTLLGAGGGL